jgi:hypothetical protein
VWCGVVWCGVVEWRPPKYGMLRSCLPTFKRGQVKTDFFMASLKNVITSPELVGKKLIFFGHTRYY